MTNESQSELPKLSAPTRRALARSGDSTLEQLTQTNETELAQLHGMGPKALDALRDSLHEHGLSSKADSSLHVGDFREQAWRPCLPPAGCASVFTRCRRYASMLILAASALTLPADTGRATA